MCPEQGALFLVVDPAFKRVSQDSDPLLGRQRGGRGADDDRRFSVAMVPSPL
jgi:hypothetical protein